MKRRKKAVDPDLQYVAVMGFATDLPTRGTVIARGKVLPGSSPIVQGHPELFAPVGEKLPSVDSLVAAAASARDLAREPTAKPRPFDSTRDRHFVAKTSWKGHAVDRRGIPHFRVLNRGEVCQPGDPLVKNNPRLFEEVKP